MVFHISHLGGMELSLSCSMSLSWLGKLSISGGTEWKYMVALSMIFFSGMSIVLLARTIAEKDL